MFHLNAYLKKQNFYEMFSIHFTTYSLHFNCSFPVFCVSDSHNSSLKTNVALVERVYHQK